MLVASEIDRENSSGGIDFNMCCGNQPYPIHILGSKKRSRLQLSRPFPVRWNDGLDGFYANPGNNAQDIDLNITRCCFCLG